MKPLPSDVIQRLHDVSAAGAAIQGFVADLDFDAFGSSDLVRAAVERKLEIIGEALHQAAKTCPELERDIPDLHAIIGMRNRIIHGYDKVDDQLVWDVATHEVPKLTVQVIPCSSFEPRTKNQEPRTKNKKP